MGRATYEQPKTLRDATYILYLVILRLQILNTIYLVSLSLYGCKKTDTSNGNDNNCYGNNKQLACGCCR